MSPVNAHEKIRTVSKKLALSIEHRAEQQAIVVIKRLQTAVNKAFDSMETDFNKQKETVTRLEEIVSIQTKLLEALGEHKENRDRLDMLQKLRSGMVDPPKVAVQKAIDESAASTKFSKIDNSFYKQGPEIHLSYGGKLKDEDAS